MKFSTLTTAALLTATLAVRPSFSQPPVQTDLNVQLKQSLCAQNWGQALRVVDRMKAAAPQQAAELTLYRGQLQSFMRSGTKIPNWPSDCSTVKASTTPTSPNTQATSTSPARSAKATPTTAAVVPKTAPTGVGNTLQHK